MKNIYLLYPSYKETPVQEIEDFLLNLPELALLQGLQLLPIPWQEDLTGSSQDWIATVRQIQQVWGKAAGFIIWLPQAAILPAAGSLQIMAKQAGKPIVLFAAGDPKQFQTKAFDRLHLVSHLINAYYVAQSDLGEVVVLTQDQVYRPDQCFWQNEAVRALTAPVANLHFGLQIKTDYYQRNAAKLELEDFKPFSDNILMLQGLPHASSVDLAQLKPDAVFVNTQANYLLSPNLQTVRKQAQAQNIPVIWQSGQTWTQQEWADNEIAVTHLNAWWVALITQFAFGQFGQLKALKQIKSLI